MCDTGKNQVKAAGHIEITWPNVEVVKSTEISGENQNRKSFQKADQVYLRQSSNGRGKCTAYCPGNAVLLFLGSHAAETCQQHKNQLIERSISGIQLKTCAVKHVGLGCFSEVM